MGDIRSAREIAMEKIEKLGEPTEKERLEWKYVPEGEKLAARYLKNDAQLLPELGKYDKQAAFYVSKGISAVLIKNINLPRDEATQRINKLAMDGIKAIKTDKAKVEMVLSQLRNIFSHYTGQGEQQRKQTYASLKADFQSKVEQALRQQMGGNTAGIRIDVESQPQFQEEWRKLKAQLDSQYLQILDESKQQLEAIN
jgi:predicted Fe-Mo cluster-binding NifX family protein